MRKISQVERYRITAGSFGSDASYYPNGAYMIMGPKGAMLKVIASAGYGWEHVSVSCENRCPNWPEMCFIKNLFWDDEEVVVQFHPKKSEYVNVHPYCLHLWKKEGEDWLLPPRELIG